MICDKENQPDAWPYLPAQKKTENKKPDEFDPRADYQTLAKQHLDREPRSPQEETYLSFYDQISNL